MAKSVFYDAYIFKYLGFNACILVQGIAVIRLLKVSDIKFLLNTFADLKKLFFLYFMGSFRFDFIIIVIIEHFYHKDFSKIKL